MHRGTVKTIVTVTATAGLHARMRIMSTLGADAAALSAAGALRIAGKAQSDGE